MISTRSRLMFTAAFVLGSSIASTARADLSDRAAGIAWDIEHFGYMDDCRYDKPVPANVDDHVVAKCEHGLKTEEEKISQAFTASDRQEPRGKAILEMHAKSTKHVAKIRALYEDAQRAQAKTNDAIAAFKKEAKENEGALWFLKGLEDHRGVRAEDDVEGKVKSVQAAKGFAARCKSTYAAIKPAYGSFVGDGEFLSEPSQACGVAMRMDDTLKKELPAVFALMRASLVKQSESTRNKLAEGEALFAGSLDCARDPGKCGSQEAQIARIAGAMGVSAGKGAPTNDAAFEAAMKKAVSVRRIGSYHDAAREGALKAALTRAKISPLALALSSNQDDVKRNDLGIPESKSRSGTFLIKKSNENFCRAYDVQATASYIGGGRYASFKAADVRLDDDNVKFVVSACK